MATLPELLARKASLEKALANPNEQTSDNGMSVRKRPVADIERALDHVNREIAAAQSTAPARILRLNPSKGY